MSVAAVANAFELARTAWKNAGREGSPRLVAVAWFAIGDIDRGRRNVWDYYSIYGRERANQIAADVHCGAAAVKAAIQAFADIGADEVMLNPSLDDIDEVARLADAVLPPSRREQAPPRPLTAHN